jgi:hypothetical protein
MLSSLCLIVIRHYTRECEKDGVGEIGNKYRDADKSLARCTKVYSENLREKE